MAGSNKQLNEVFQGIVNAHSKPIEKSKIHFDNHSDVVKNAEEQDAIRKATENKFDQYSDLLFEVMNKLTRDQDNPPEQSDFDLLNNILKDD